MFDPICASIRAGDLPLPTETAQSAALEEESRICAACEMKVVLVFYRLLFGELCRLFGCEAFTMSKTETFKVASYLKDCMGVQEENLDDDDECISFLFFE